MKKYFLSKKLYCIFLWLYILGTLQTTLADDIFSSGDQNVSSLGRDPGVCKDKSIPDHEKRTNTTARLFDLVASNTKEGLLGRSLEKNGFVEHPGVCLTGGIVLFIYNNRLHDAVSFAEGFYANGSNWREIELSKLLESTSSGKPGTAQLPNLFKLTVTALAPSNTRFVCHGYGLNPRHPPDHHFVKVHEKFPDLAKLWGWGKQIPYNPKNLTPDSTWLIIYGTDHYFFTDEAKTQIKLRTVLRHTALWDKGKISAKMGEELGVFQFEHLDQLSGGGYGSPRYMLKLEHPEFMNKEVPSDFYHDLFR